MPNTCCARQMIARLHHSVTGALFRRIDRLPAWSSLAKGRPPTRLVSRQYMKVGVLQLQTWWLVSARPRTISERVKVRPEYRSTTARDRPTLSPRPHCRSFGYEAAPAFARDGTRRRARHA